MEENRHELLEFFKTLADVTRLKIIGLLALSEYTVEKMAEILDLHPSAVSHHLTKLSKVGLVGIDSKNYSNIYYLNNSAFEERKRILLVKEVMPKKFDIELDDYCRKVINTYVDNDGRIPQFPAQRKKFEIILQYVAHSFKPEVQYSEKQINEILSYYSDDTATLRRNLVTFGIMDREDGGGKYWLKLT